MGEGNRLRDRLTNDLPDEGMCLSECEAARLYEVVRECGGRGVVPLHRPGETFGVELQSRNRGVHYLNGLLCVREPLPEVGSDLLEVEVVGVWEPLQDGADSLKRPEDGAAFRPYEFGGDGVLLLRHDTTGGGVLVRDLYEAKLFRRPEDDLLRDPAQLDHQHLASGESLDREVARRDCIHRVVDYPREAEEGGDQPPVDAYRSPRERCRPHRREVDPLVQLEEPLAVALNRVKVREEVVRQGNRLGVLEVSESRDDCSSVTLDHP